MHKITVYGSGPAVDSAVEAFKLAIAQIESARTYVESAEVLVGCSWSEEDVRSGLEGRLGDEVEITDETCAAILREIGGRVAELADERGNAALDDLMTDAMLAKHGLVA